MSDKLDVQLSFRVPKHLATGLAEVAAHHGRSPSQEARLALDLHRRRAEIHYLNGPLAGRTLGGKAASRAAEQAALAHRRLEQVSFGPRPGMSLAVQHGNEKQVGDI